MNPENLESEISGVITAKVFVNESEDREDGDLDKSSNFGVTLFCCTFWFVLALIYVWYLYLHPQQ